MDDFYQFKMAVYTSLFVSLISIGAFIFIPIGPVPIVLQNMFVFLAAIILGPVWGVSCVIVYLLMGLVGLPVFAGGTSGIARLFGPTGGYLLGYIPAVIVIAGISKIFNGKFVFDIIAMILGSLVLYFIGVRWLMAVSGGLDFATALKIGMYPFLIGDAIKIIAAAFIARVLRPVIKL